MRNKRQHSKMWCSPDCYQNARARPGLPRRRDLVAYLMKRDHGRCGKCREPIRAKKGPRGPSIGHIIPVSLGGEHALENLQPEHLDCNQRAGNRGGGEQLLLIG